MPLLWFQSFGTPYRLKPHQFQTFLPLGKETTWGRNNDTSTAGKACITFPQGPPLPLSQVSFLHSKVRVWPFLFNWSNSSKSSVFVKSKWGENVFSSTRSHLRASNRRAQEEVCWSNVITPISHNEYTIPLMTGNEDANSHKHTKLGLCHWSESAGRNMNTPGQWRGSRLIRIDNSRAVRMSVRDCAAQGQTHRTA